jgi:outer membrane protein with beta-barrel domain
MRKTTKILLALGAAVVLIPASDASAQRRRGLVDVSHRHERHGAWLTFGLGAGRESYHYSNGPAGYSDEKVKPSFWLAVGGTVNPHLRLGGEINAWVNEFDESGEHITESLVSGMLTGHVFPIRDLGLFAKGGIGISRSGSDISGGFGTGETGFAYSLGAGYEIRLARNFFLVPTVNFLQHASSQGGTDPDNLGTLHERVFTIGVGLTFQPGR